MEIEVYNYPDMPEEFYTGTQKDEEDKYNIEVAYDGMDMEV